jgi:hypothetical protein
MSFWLLKCGVFSQVWLCGKAKATASFPCREVFELYVIKKAKTTITEKSKE